MQCLCPHVPFSYHAALKMSLKLSSCSALMYNLTLLKRCVGFSDVLQATYYLNLYEQIVIYTKTFSMNKWFIRSQRTGHSLRKVRYSSGYCINITGWFYAWSTFRWWVSLQHSIYSIPAFSRASIPCTNFKQHLCFSKP